MKHILQLLCIQCVIYCSSSAAAPPHIIVNLSDDHGWADLGANGMDKHIRTPNVDQLARDGARFSRVYVTAPPAQQAPASEPLHRGRNSAGKTITTIPLKDDGKRGCGEKELRA